MTTPAALESLAHGDHACYVFDSDVERIHLAVAFAHAGIERRDKVLLLADEDDDATARSRLLAEMPPDLGVAIERAQVEVSSARSILAPDGRFLIARVLAALKQQERRAVAAGFAGLAVIGEMSWILQTDIRGEAVPEYERVLGPALASGPSVAVCQYDRRRFDAGEISAAVGAHPHQLLAAAHGAPLLRVVETAAAARLALVGELDVSTAPTLAATLARYVPRRRSVHLDMRGLRFIDAAGLRCLTDAAGRLGSDVSLVLESPPEQVRRVLVLAGLDVHPGIRIAGSSDD